MTGHQGLETKRQSLWSQEGWFEPWDAGLGWRRQGRRLWGMESESLGDRAKATRGQGEQLAGDEP